MALEELEAAGPHSGKKKDGGRNTALIAIMVVGGLLLFAFFCVVAVFVGIILLMAFAPDSPFVYSLF